MADDTKKSFVKHRIALLSLLSLFALSRLLGIGWGLPEPGCFHQSFHPDEIGNLNSIVNTHPDVYSDYQKGWYYNKGPVMYEVWKIVIRTAQSLGLAPSYTTFEEWKAYPAGLRRLYLAGRLTTVCFSLLLAFLVYRIGTVLMEKPVGLLALVCLMLMPGELVSAHYMKTDVPATALGTAALAFVIGAGPAGLAWQWCGAGVFAALAAGTKYNSLLFLLPLGFWWLGEEKRKTKILWFSAGFLPALFLAWHPLFLVPGEFISGFAEQFRVQGRPMGGAIPFAGRWLTWSLATGATTILLAMLGAVGLARRKEWRLLVVLAAWVLPVAAVTSRGWPLVRYTVPALPALAILASAAYPVVRTGNKWRRRLVKVVLVMCLALPLWGCLKELRLFRIEDPRCTLVLPHPNISMIWCAPEKGPLGIPGIGLYFNPPYEAGRTCVNLVEDGYTLQTAGLGAVILNIVHYAPLLARLPPDAPESVFYNTLTTPPWVVGTITIPNDWAAAEAHARLPWYPLDWLYNKVVLEWRTIGRPFDGTKLERPAQFPLKQNKYYVLP